MKIDIDKKKSQSKLSIFFSSENGRIKENNENSREIGGYDQGKLHCGVGRYAL